MNIHLSFHTILFLAYTIPNIYLILRINSLFIGRKCRIWYFIVYLLLAMIYPAGEQLSERYVGLSFLETISGYLIPFFLYLFLLVLFFDILLLFNLILRIVPVVKIKDRHFRTKAFITILLLDVAIVTGGIVNFNTIRTSEYQIIIPRRSSELNHLRIAFAADFHIQEKTGINFVRRFAEKIKDIDPDILILGGDIIEGDSDDGNVQEHASVLKSIHPRYGIFAVLGNHEYYSGQDDGSFFDRAGIKVLCDTVIAFDGLFSIAGRYDSHYRQRKQIRDILASATDSLPLILVDHRPTEIDQVSLTEADIQFSGHTHNGQLFPVSLITRKVYQLSWGYMKKGNAHFFVTSGIRLWGPPVRTAGKSEIMIIDIDLR